MDELEMYKADCRTLEKEARKMAKEISELGAELYSLKLERAKENREQGFI